MEPALRRQLRDRFILLATKYAGDIQTKARLLAEHAFRLPESQLSVAIAINKTDAYLKLEEALQNNRWTILHRSSTTNTNESHTLEQLRVQATKLILKMTEMTQCENRLVSCKPSIT
ncbi:unnamed protein product, partial [Rotaria sp. Silwood2]